MTSGGTSYTQVAIAAEPYDVRVAQWWYSWTTACPLPRPIIQWLTGSVTTNATASENARATQNTQFARPAPIAPGTPTITALSTTSITRIEIVSAASATLIAAPQPR